MIQPSTKQRVTIEYFNPNRYISPDSLFTKTVASALEIVRGKQWAKRAWFRGKLIFEK